MAFMSRETRKKEAKAFIKDFLKAAGPGLVILFIAFGILIASNIVGREWTNTLSGKSNEVNILSAQVKQSIMKLDQIKTESRNLYLGVDLDRKAKDDVIAQEVFEHALTWTGKEQGMALILDIVDRYPDLPRSYSVGVFGIERRDEFERSKEIACAFKSFKSYVKSVSEDTYEYMAIVSFSQVLSDGTRLQKNFLTSYSLDSAGKFYGFTYDEVIK